MEAGWEGSGEGEGLEGTVMTGGEGEHCGFCAIY